MLERLGAVSNCWRKVLDSGALFEQLVNGYCRAGLNQIEIRDGKYLRGTSFGGLISDVERVMWNYDFDGWRDVCDRIHSGADWRESAGDGDAAVLSAVEGFIHETAGAVYSYAMAFPWMVESSDIPADNGRIATAFRLAYLLNPERSRVRLVSLVQVEKVDCEVAVANLKRYRHLFPANPATLTVENARYPASLIFELAMAGGVSLAYDEANNYLPDGSELNGTEDFWRSVRVQELASVHLKQTNTGGALPRLGDGFVDMRALLHRLNEGGYAGDLLFELAPSDDPLEDALYSRDYLHQILCG